MSLNDRYQSARNRLEEQLEEMKKYLTDDSTVYSTILNMARLIDANYEFMEAFKNYAECYITKKIIMDDSNAE